MKSRLKTSILLLAVFCISCSALFADAVFTADDFKRVSVYDERGKRIDDSIVPTLEVLSGYSVKTAGTEAAFRFGNINVLMRENTAVVLVSARSSDPQILLLDGSIEVSSAETSAPLTIATAVNILIVMDNSFASVVSSSEGDWVYKEDGNILAYNKITGQKHTVLSGVLTDLKDGSGEKATLREAKAKEIEVISRCTMDIAGTSFAATYYRGEGTVYYNDGFGAQDAKQFIENALDNPVLEKYGFRVTASGETSVSFSCPAGLSHSEAAEILTEAAVACSAQQWTANTRFKASLFGNGFTGTIRQGEAWLYTPGNLSYGTVSSFADYINRLGGGNYNAQALRNTIVLTYNPDYSVSQASGFISDAFTAYDNANFQKQIAAAALSIGIAPAFPAYASFTDADKSISVTASDTSALLSVSPDLGPENIKTALAAIAEEDSLTSLSGGKYLFEYGQQDETSAASLILNAVSEAFEADTKHIDPTLYEEAEDIYANAAYEAWLSYAEGEKRSLQSWNPTDGALDKLSEIFSLYDDGVISRTTVSAVIRGLSATEMLENGYRLSLFVTEDGDVLLLPENGKPDKKQILVEFTAADAAHLRFETRVLGVEFSCILDGVRIDYMILGDNILITNLAELADTITAKWVAEFVSLVLESHGPVTGAYESEGNLVLITRGAKNCDALSLEFEQTLNSVYPALLEKMDEALIKAVSDKTPVPELSLRSPDTGIPVPELIRREVYTLSVTEESEEETISEEPEEKFFNFGAQICAGINLSGMEVQAKAEVLKAYIDSNRLSLKLNIPVFSPYLSLSGGTFASDAGLLSGLIPQSGMDFYYYLDYALSFIESARFSTRHSEFSASYNSDREPGLSFSSFVATADPAFDVFYENGRKPLVVQINSDIVSASLFIDDVLQKRNDTIWGIFNLSLSPFENKQLYGGIGVNARYFSFASSNLEVLPTAVFNIPFSDSFGLRLNAVHASVYPQPASALFSSFMAEADIYGNGFSIGVAYNGGRRFSSTINDTKALDNTYGYLDYTRRIDGSSLDIIARYSFRGEIFDASLYADVPFAVSPMALYKDSRGTTADVITLNMGFDTGKFGARLLFSGFGTIGRIADAFGSSFASGSLFEIVKPENCALRAQAFYRQGVATINASAAIGYDSISAAYVPQVGLSVTIGVGK